MTLPEGCPRCGDQTLWSHNQGEAWCNFCGHTWRYERPVLEGQQVFVCDDPEGQWIKDQEEEANS